MLITLWSREARVFADLISTEHMPASQDLSWPCSHSTPVFQDIWEDCSTFLKEQLQKNSSSTTPLLPGKETRKSVSPSSLNVTPVSTWTSWRKKRKQKRRDAKEWGTWEPGAGRGSGNQNARNDQRKQTRRKINSRAQSRGDWPAAVCTAYLAGWGRKVASTPLSSENLHKALFSPVHSTPAIP